jgi:hypothetical protein
MAQRRRRDWKRESRNNAVNHMLQRFEVAGSHGEGFSAGKGLVNNQTESAGADEPTVPRPSCSGSNPRGPWAESLSLGR